MKRTAPVKNVRGPRRVTIRFDLRPPAEIPAGDPMTVAQCAAVVRPGGQLDRERRCLNRSAYLPASMLCGVDGEWLCWRHR